MLSDNGGYQAEFPAAGGHSSSDLDEVIYIGAGARIALENGLVVFLVKTAMVSDFAPEG
jgi:hypothetical protein